MSHTSLSSADLRVPPAENTVIDKLSRIVPLDNDEREALRTISLNSRRMRRGTDLISEGDKPGAVFMVLEGWAYRYKSTVCGGQQIMAYLLPGDICDVRISLFEEMDHSIGLLSDALVVKIPAREMLELMGRHPRIERALTWATLVDEATLREWLLNVGQRNALQRIAHLFCELCIRLRVVKLVDTDNTFALPLTQAELADTTGMTAVHVNRSLQRLRQERLIVLKNGELTILDLARLAEVGGFDARYLHIDRPAVAPKLRSCSFSPM